MSHIFLDTVALITLAVKSDALHNQAMSLRKQLVSSGARIITSHWVLAEFLNAMSDARTRVHALKTVEALEHSARTTIVPADIAGWRAAVEMYRQRPDKDWSLVDCSSISICQERDIRRVFTNDHHFKQAGLEALLQ